MKTTKCSNCGAEVPINTVVCPHCKERCLSDKSNKQAMIFAFSLGMFGAHNFYLGFQDKSWLECGLTVLGILLFVFGLIKNVTTYWVCGIIIMGIILIVGIVEGVLLAKKIINRDKYGKRLK